MASHDRRSVGFGRTESARQSLQQDDDDEDYDLAAMGISDGFRPGMGGMGHMGQVGEMPTTGNRLSQTSQHHLAQGRRSPPPRPSSISKPKGIDSFALRHDGAMGSMRRTSAMVLGTNSAITRSSSISTDMGYVRPESPYRGPSGPSHPYQMYPQESRLARTASVATTSTIQVPDRPYTGPGGPTHPYGIYPQNFAEAEISEPAIPTEPAVPVGFPGANSNYQRRLGPDGEEIADLIGPDGHTEQLPPYTQYPDEALARKTRPNIVPLPAISSGAGGLGLATRNPEFESQEDLGSISPRSQRSTRSIISETSDHDINMGAGGASEKPKLKRWQQIAHKKLCHIVPIWVLVLVAIIFILFGIILGTVLAVLKSKHPPPKHHDDDGVVTVQSVVVTTMTTTYDATPFTTAPIGLPTLPTGTFALPISAPSAIQNSCLSNTAQSAAWSCQVPGFSYTITVTQVPGMTNNLRNNEVDLSLANTTGVGNIYWYGAQPPVLSQSQILNLATDNQETDRGPAWFFELPYNKVVIVPQDLLSGAGSIHPDAGGVNQRRHSIGEFTRKQVAQAGDYPWFCYWNGTLLEAFLYVNLTSSAGSNAGRTTTTTSSSAKASANINSNSGWATASSPGNNNMPLIWLPAYPKVLKLEERRVPGFQTIAPYCIQQHINYSGIASPVLNSTGLPVMILLNETQASSISQMGSKRSLDFKTDEVNHELSERQSTGGSCGCAWLWT